MNKFRSPTLLGLILIGFLVVSAPLVATIVTGIVQVDRLARGSREALAAVQTATSAAKQLREDVTELERTARQYQALGDPVYMDRYRARRRSAVQVLDQLSGAAADRRIRQLAYAVRRRIADANAVVDSIGEGQGPAALVAAFDALGSATRELMLAQDGAVARMGNEMPAAARDLQQLMIMQAMLVLPLSAGLAAVFGVHISRSLRRLDAGIRSLGGGDLEQPVRVAGPRDFEELGQRLDWLRSRLLELQAEKQGFLRSVSHELKTPLTNIREGAELLTESSDQTSAAEREAIARIVRDNSIRLQFMIEALLQFGTEAEMDAAEGESPVYLDRVVSAAIDRKALSLAGREVDLTADVEPVVVRGNARKLHAIVDNLLSNAINYTPGGGSIRVSLSANDTIVTLDVADSGPGVTDEDRPHVFEWLYSGRRAERSFVTSSGMGLAIAQEYARHHGGELQLMESSRGAHFRLTIPYQGGHDA